MTEIAAKVHLDCFNRLKPLLSVLIAKMLIQNRAMRPFDKSVVSWTAYRCGLMFVAFELKKTFIGMPVWTAAEFTPGIRKDRLDPG